MLESSEIKFDSGKILTKSMLEGLSAYSYGIANILYLEYTDGIIQGLEFKYLDNMLNLTPGILKYNGRIYLLKQSIVLSAKMADLAEGENYFITLNESFEKNESIQNWQLDVTIGQSNFGFLLGSFICRKERLIKIEFNKLDDFTDKNFLDVLSVNYAGIGKTTISPKIFKAFAQQLLAKNNIPNYLCGAIVAKAINGESISRELTRELIALCGFPVDQIGSNLGLLNSLKAIADQPIQKSGNFEKPKTETINREFVNPCNKWEY